jgi:hypothetical protein
MIRQESTYDKETGEIIDFKEYCNNIIITHHINEKNYTSIKNYNEGKLYSEQINEVKNKRILYTIYDTNTEILHHTESDLNGVKLKIYKQNSIERDWGIIRFFEFDNKKLNKKYSSFGYKLGSDKINSNIFFNKYYIQLQTTELINDHIHIKYHKKYYITEQQCTHLCTWTYNPKALTLEQLEYINNIILPKQKPYEQKPYHK